MMQVYFQLKGRIFRYCYFCILLRWCVKAPTYWEIKGTA